MKPIKKISGLSLSAVVASALIASAGPASANSKTAPQGARAQVGYDWHANARPRSAGGAMTVQERKRFAARIARHGNGSYICSPSGFGKKSKCHSRG